MSDTGILIRLLAERLALVEAKAAVLDARVAVFERAAAQHEQNARQELLAQIEQLQQIIRDDTARQAQATARADGA